MILVTGATGHIGNVLVRELLAKGEVVRALVLPGEDCSALAGLPVEIVEGNVLDPQSLIPAFQGVHTVYHLAGIITIMPGKDDLVRKVNIQGTKNIIRAARQVKVNRLIYTSSIHAFKRLPEGVIIDETVPFDPDSTANEYDRSKAEATLAVLEETQQGLDAVIVCPTGVIGPHDYRLSEMGALFLDWIKNRLNFIINGYFDFVDVRDIARGMMLACEKGRIGECYILSGQRINLIQMMKLVKEAIGRRYMSLSLPIRLARFTANFTPLFCRLTRSKPRFTSYSIETVMSNSNISCAKAQRELGYTPRSLKVTIGDTVNWWFQHRHLWK